MTTLSRRSFSVAEKLHRECRARKREKERREEEETLFPELVKAQIVPRRSFKWLATPSREDRGERLAASAFSLSGRRNYLSVSKPIGCRHFHLSD